MKKCSNENKRTNWVKMATILTAFVLLCSAFMPDIATIVPFASASACEETTKSTDDISSSRYKTKEATVYTGQFPMITSDNGHVCGFYNGGNIYRIGAQTPITCVPSFYPYERFAKVMFYEGYHGNIFMTDGFSEYYGSFKILPGCEEDFWRVLQNRYGTKFGIDVTELANEEIPKAISFSSMRFDTFRGNEYGTHQYFRKDETKRLVAYLVFGGDERYSIPVYVGEAKGDYLYHEILGFESTMFDSYGIDYEKCAIYGVHLFGHGDFMLRESNAKLQGMISPDETVESLGYQVLNKEGSKEVSGPSNLTEHGPIRSKSKSEVNLEDMYGFTNLYIEADIDPEWVEYFFDYICYIIEVYNIPEGPDQLAQALALGATHFEFYSETSYKNGEVKEISGVKSSNIFFTSKTIRYLIGKVWFYTGYVDLYFGDFYGDGKLVLGFAAGYRNCPTPTPTPTATPAPATTPVRPVTPTKEPTCTKTCPPCIVPFGIGVTLGYTLSTFVRVISK